MAIYMTLSYRHIVVSRNTLFNSCNTWFQSTFDHVCLKRALRHFFPDLKMYCSLISGGNKFKRQGVYKVIKQHYSMFFKSTKPFKFSTFRHKYVQIPLRHGDTNAYKWQKITKLQNDSLQTNVWMKNDLFLFERPPHLDWYLTNNICEAGFIIIQKISFSPNCTCINRKCDFADGTADSAVLLK